MAGILREPLLHFAVFGGLIFAGFQFFGTPEERPGSAQVISYDADALEQMKQKYAGIWKRPPSEEEFAHLLQAEIENELLVREALALGLDRNDPVIRNRLVQKMLFLATSAAQAMEPADDVLQAHLESSSAAFAEPPQLTFVQIYLGGELPSDNGSALLADLAAGADPAELGVPSMLPRHMSGAEAPAVDSNYGSGFAEQVLAQPKGVWSGPVQSGFGWHLVRLDAAAGGRVPELEEIRDSVLFDWRRVLADDLTAGQIAQLRSRYDIRLPEGAPGAGAEDGQ
jgi:hypothetical protein